MVYSQYTKQIILKLFTEDNLIASILAQEGLIVSRQGIRKFLKRYHVRNTIPRLQGSGRQSLISEEVSLFVEHQMQIDDETTAYQLHTLLQHNGFLLSMRTVLRCRTQLGWTFRGSSYCQLRETNKVNTYFI